MTRVDPKKQRARTLRTAFGVVLIAVGVFVFLRAPEHAELLSLALVGFGGVIIEPPLVLQVLRVVTRQAPQD